MQMGVPLPNAGNEEIGHSLFVLVPIISILITAHFVITHCPFQEKQHQDETNNGE
jgi:hypothetical protein